MKCPFCGAEFNAPPGRKIYVCPYCGTAISEGKTYERVYIFKPSVDKTSAFKKVLNFRPFGSPDDLDRATPASAELHFLPLYLYHVTFEPLNELETYATALAISAPPLKVPKSYVFPARGYTAFRPSLEKTGVFHTPDLDPEDAVKLLGDLMDEAETYAQVFKTRIVVRWSFEGLVYHPMWDLVYDYNGRRYNAVVDATDGTVLYMEYPLSKRGRAEGAGAAAISALGAAALGALAALYAGLSPWLGAFGGMLASSGAVYRLLSYSLARVGKYAAERRL